MSMEYLTCIGCPMGCQLEVELENGQVLSVSGHTCKRGELYAKKEVTNPTRIVTSTVRVLHSRTGAVTVSCKTRSDVPKQRIFDCIKDLKGVCMEAPVHIGDVVKHNVAGTGVDMVATKDVQ